MFNVKNKNMFALYHNTSDVILPVFRNLRTGKEWSKSHEVYPCLWHSRKSATANGESKPVKNKPWEPNETANEGFQDSH